jgi:hypothetical protein
MMFYFECDECGFDSDEAKRLVDQTVAALRPICPLCVGDSGHHNPLTFRRATDAEIKKLS